MQRYEAIENGIKNNDISALREAIGSICYTSRDFSSGEFDEAIKYVESKGIKLKDDMLMGNTTISSIKEDFTDEDFADAVFELKNNFCDERINDVKIIGKKLYGRIPKGDNETNISNGASPNHQSHQSGLIILVAIIIIVIVVFIQLKK